jgi:hypothetical protein
MVFPAIVGSIATVRYVGRVETELVVFDIALGRSSLIAARVAGR